MHDEVDPQIAELYQATTDGLERVYYEPHSHRRLQRVARNIVRDPSIAGEIVANCFADRYAAAVRYLTHEDLQQLQEAARVYGNWRYAATSVHNKAIDYVRSKDRSVVSTDALVAPDSVRMEYLNDLPSQFSDPADIVVHGLDGEGRHIRTLVEALGQRHTKAPGSTLTLSPEQMEHLAFFYRFNLLPDQQSAVDNAEPDDPAARDRKIERIKKQEKRKVPGYDPNFGMNAALAKHFGTRAYDITRKNTRIVNIMRMAIYLVAVLGRYDATHSVEAIDEHLHIFDQWKTDRTREPAIKRLRLASTSIRTNEHNGARVSAIAYAQNLGKWQHADPAGSTPLDASDWEKINVEAENLHTVESAYANDASSPYPRCVLVCAPHTP